jgi:hypothetical protein
MEAIRPALAAKAFNCPHCAAFAHQVWHRLLSIDTEREALRAQGLRRLAMLHTETPQPEKPTDALRPASSKLEAPQLFPSVGTPTIDNTVLGTMLSVCVSCRKVAIWVGENMVHPAGVLAALPHAQMPPEATKTFREAAAIAALSPRSAAALLRLAVEQICHATEVKPGRINDMIAEMVRNGLHAQVQMALDIVRVTGNEAVHPGQIDTDNAEVVKQLFELTNLIVEEIIARPFRIKKIYNELPAEKRDAILRRDGKHQSEEG